ncbi:hypothetical protein, partial [Rhizobium sp. BK251]|uniref:hypothetical protein n=1 Tax=Rhizobium sp. BK251 TaxID=2512125 RepID=UPI001A9ED5D4
KIALVIHSSSFLHEGSVLRFVRGSVFHFARHTSPAADLRMEVAVAHSAMAVDADGRSGSRMPSFRPTSP